MFKRIKSILLAVGVVMIFTAQTPNVDNNHMPAHKAAPAATHQNKPQAPNHQSAPHQQVQRPPVKQPQHVQAQVHIPVPVVQRQTTRQPVRQQAAIQQTAFPRVYAKIPTPANSRVDNNRLFHRQHHNHWQPRYNFYSNEYHFYPYVNVTSPVELSSNYISIGFNGQNYAYDQGTFYLQDATGQWLAVAPPVGIIVNPIAEGAGQIIVNGQSYYRYKGVFYIQVAQGYQVVGPVAADNS